MGLIEKEEAARRLARVILSDIELYNVEKIRAGHDLRREISEGYRLFRSRVAPDLVSLFAEAVEQKGRGGNAAFAVPAESLAPSGSTPRPFSASLPSSHPGGLMEAALPGGAASLSPRFEAPSLAGAELSRGKLSKVRLITALAALILAGFLISHFLAR
jgi:hypothetical protein